MRIHPHCRSLPFGYLCAFLLSVSCVAAGQITVEDFDSIRLYTLRNQAGMTVKVTNFGAIITSIVVPDRGGKMADVALGFARVEDYINAVDKPYFGAIVGRYGNRIAEGRFEVGGQAYQLAINDGQNHLHGGTFGFDKVVWDAESVSDDEGGFLQLDYHSKDGEEGYPGNLEVRVTYRLTEDNRLVVHYWARTDRPTPVNLTQHTYFNLKGEGNGNILDHALTLNAQEYTPVDAGLIPTGEMEKVAGTPFDFRQAKPIGRDIDVDDPQLKMGKGYDHNFILARDNADDSLVLAARVTEPTTGRVLEIRTTEPGIQFYSGNFLDGRLIGKSGQPYLQRGGFCLEPQHYPDSPNQPQFPSTILRPDEVYRSVTVFSFSTQ